MVVVYEFDDDQDEPCASTGARRAKMKAIIVARMVVERILKECICCRCDPTRDDL